MQFVDARQKRQILTCLWPNIDKGIVKISTDMRQTRSVRAPQIHLPIPKNELFEKIVSYYGATLWNPLPPNNRICDNIDSFNCEMNKKTI